MKRGLEDELNEITANMVSPQDQGDVVSYAIFGAVATTTRAFDKVTLKVDVDTSRVFVTVTLRWWAKFKKFERLHEAWLRIAEKRATEFLPTGWKILIYYAKK